MENENLLKELSVLCIEDDKLMLETLSKILRRKVKVVYEANDGDEGLEFYKKYNPDIVVTDIEMPTMSGVVMIDEIRKISSNKKPIIVITAYDDKAHFSKLADTYIYKPVISKVLVEKITTLWKEYLSKEKIWVKKKLYESIFI